MKEKVLNLRAATSGVQIGAKVYNTIDMEKDKMEMETSELGVFVNSKGSESRFFIPYSMIGSLHLAPKAKK